MPTWVRQLPSRSYYRPKTFVRPPVLVTSYPTTEFVALPAGKSGLLFYDITFAAVTGQAGPIIPVAWKTSRYSNRIGQWAAEIPIDDQLVGTTPIHTQIKRGWHVCLIQESNYPEHDNSKEYLLYMGVVLDHEFLVTENGARLRLTGAFRSQHLVDRKTIGSLRYNGRNITYVANQLVSGSSLIGTPGGITLPNHPNRKVSATYTDVTRFAALLMAARQARYAYRESWDHDKPELVPYDGPPDSGITFINEEAWGPGLDDAGEAGFGIIAGQPAFTVEGSSVVTRVIPIGTDTTEEDTPLTLGHATRTSPYTVQTGVDEGGSAYYYIADATAEAAHGVIEHRLIRTDVRNPSDNSTTRRLAANVLYATGVDFLIKNRSPRQIVRVAIANGNNIWALPGDMVRLDYQGYVQSSAGAVVWKNFNKTRFVIVERHDTSDPSGVRGVEFVLAAPEIEFPIPSLPDAIVLPPYSPPALPPLPPEPPLPPYTDPLQPPIVPPGYMDPTTEVNNGAYTPYEGDESWEDWTYDTVTPGVNLPVGVLRTNDDVLEYWDGANWQNYEASLDTSDPGGGRVWLE